MNGKEILKEFDDKYKDMYGGLFVFDANLRPIQDEVKQSLSDLINQAEKEIAIAYNEGYNKAVKKYVAEKKEARIDIRTEFIKEFCNDHNEDVRWIRSVALSEEHLLDKILEFFNNQLKEKE